MSSAVKTDVCKLNIVTTVDEAEEQDPSLAAYEMASLESSDYEQ